jgi:hypothetical protein
MRITGTMLTSLAALSLTWVAGVSCQEQRTQSARDRMEQNFPAPVDTREAADQPASGRPTAECPDPNDDRCPPQEGD